MDLPEVRTNQGNDAENDSLLDDCDEIAAAAEEAAQAVEAQDAVSEQQQQFDQSTLRCRVCGTGAQQGRPMLRFLPTIYDPAIMAVAPGVLSFTEDIALHVFCGKTASILPNVNRPDLEVLTKAGLKNKHGTGAEVNAAMIRTRSSVIHEDGGKQKCFYLVREFEAHLSAIRNCHIDQVSKPASSSLTVSSIALPPSNRAGRPSANNTNHSHKNNNNSNNNTTNNTTNNNRKRKANSNNRSSSSNNSSNNSSNRSNNSNNGRKNANNQRKPQSRRAVNASADNVINQNNANANFNSVNSVSSRTQNNQIGSLMSNSGNATNNNVQNHSQSQHTLPLFMSMHNPSMPPGVAMSSASSMMMPPPPTAMMMNATATQYAQLGTNMNAPLPAGNFAVNVLREFMGGAPLPSTSELMGLAPLPNPDSTALPPVNGNPAPSATHAKQRPAKATAGRISKPGRRPNETAESGKVKCACGGSHLPTDTPRGLASYRNHIMTKRHRKWMESNSVSGFI